MHTAGRSRRKPAARKPAEPLRAADLPDGMHPRVAEIWGRGAAQPPFPPPAAPLAHATQDVLKARFPHPRDAAILFMDHGHKYGLQFGGRWLDNGKLTSVTKIIEYVDKFDREGAAFGALKGLENKKKAFFADKAIIKRMATLTVAERRAFMLDYFGPLMECKTNEDVWKVWGVMAQEASAAGTALHLDIERHINDQPPLLPDSVEWQQYLQFVRDHPQLDILRTEWRIWHEEFLLTGTIDLVYVTRRDAEGNVTGVGLGDWKRAKNIYDEGKFTKHFLPPLQSMASSSINKYTIQLNLYAFMVEKKYALEVTEMFICVFHPNYPGYQKITVERQRAAVELLLERHLAVITGEAASPAES
jgi:hypothetical protein